MGLNPGYEFPLCTEMSSSAQPQWNLAWEPAGVETGDAWATLKLLGVLTAGRQLNELARMRAAGMEWVGRLEDVLAGRIDPDLDPAFAKSRGFVFDFVKVARAVRQIMVLEQELTGLRPVRRRTPKDDGDEPDWSPGSRGRRRSSWRPLRPDDGKDCYDFRPVDEAVEWIRKTLFIEAPANDPFREASQEPESEPPAEADAPEACASEPEAAAQAPAVTERRAQGRAYDLDLRDLPGEALCVARVGGDATARGPP